MFLPKGVILRQNIINYISQKQKQAGYKEVLSPHIAKIELFEQSGHWQNYRENIFANFDNFALKPMNCPFHIEIYDSKKRSHNELPIRFSEFGQVYRNECSGSLNGLLRARSFMQDDAHVFLALNQLEQEIFNIINLFIDIYKGLNLNNFQARLSLRDDKNKYIGNDELWEVSESFLRKALNQSQINFIEGKGEAAFYGPKIDFIFKDIFNRDWQLGTIQLDFNLPKRFNLKYIDENNQEQMPIIIHRAPVGSIERLIALLLEQSQGKLPFWLAPEQVRIIPINDDCIKYSNELLNELQINSVRSEVDLSKNRLNAKIRNAKLNKIPVVIIIGKKELKEDFIQLNINNNLIKVHKKDLIQFLIKGE